jgi:hypothetical protein
MFKLQDYWRDSARVRLLFALGESIASNREPNANDLRAGMVVTVYTN